MNTEKILTQLTDLAVQYGPKLLGAIVVLFVGIWVINIITKGFEKFMIKSKMDKSLIPFLRGLVNVTLKILLVVSVMGMVGIQMTSFVAILGAVGLAVGMALSGTLQNFAGGVIILIFKPFKAGDFIEAQGHSGVVSEIQIFNTILKTADNKTIIIPNGGLSTSSMTNYSTEKYRRVDFTFSVAYGESVDKGKAILRRIIKEDTRILNEPAVPFVEIAEMDTTSVKLAVRVWVNAADYWDVFFSVQHNVYNSFNDENICAPYPQMDVRLVGDKR
jgi:small conductance mechanosensitive channel